MDAAEHSNVRSLRRGSRAMPKAWVTALQISLIYAVLGVAWILLSDRIAVGLAGDMSQLESWQLGKGLAFVLGTAALLFGLVHRNSQRHLRTLGLLAEREEYFRALFEDAPSAYQSLDAEGIILDVNQAWLDLFGYDCRAEVIGRPVTDFVDSAQHGLLRDQFHGFLGCGSISSLEFQMRRQDGQPVIVLVDGRVQRGTDDRMQRTHCVLHDISERKRVETALRESEEQLREALAAHEQVERERDRLFDLSLDLFGVTDMNGAIQTINPAWTAVLGWSEAELREHGWTDLVHPDDVAATRQAFADLARGEPVQEFVNRYRHRDGGYRWLSWNIRPDPAAGELLLTGRDVSERVQLEDQLRHAQKLEAVGQLAGGVAHDFNNLLQVINGYTELCLDGASEDAPDRRFLVEISRAGKRAAELVTQLLAFSRRQVLRPEPLDPNEVVAAMLTMITRTLGEHIEVAWRPADQPGRVNADRNQFEQALMNLCLNARDAMPEGGRLVIATSDVDLSPEDCRNRPWARPGRYVKLSVSDDGRGIEPVALEHVWEPFYTTKAPGEGSGLGLSTVYGIVRQHDGLVHVHSIPGRGTTLDLYFRRLEPRAGAAGDPVGQGEGGHETILVAEDSVDVRELLSTVLERAGYTVLMAADGEAALALLQERGSAVDLAVLDVVMPGLGGREIWERVRDDLPDLRVLFASGYSLDLVQSGFMLDEDCELIQKPFEVPELLARVRGILDRD